MKPLRLTGLGVCAVILVALMLAVGGGSSPDSTAAGATVSARAATRATSGHALKAIWGGNALPDGTSAFPTYKKLGVDVLQVQLSWRSAAATKPANAADPGDPAYHWPAELDQAAAGAAASGIKLLILVRQTPAWANGGKAQQYTPTAPADFGAFLTAAAKRYSGVHYWMIWGEPTRAGNYEPMPAGKPTGPRSYAKLLDASYGALKKVSKRNIVIGGDTWTLGLVTPVDFVRWMRLPNGKPPRLDYYGHNPYSTRFPDIRQPTYFKGLIDISDVDTLHGLLRKAYGKKKNPPLWLSEFSIADKKNRAFDFAVNRVQQARWLKAAYHLANSQSYVAGLGWYTLTDEPASVPGAITNGLLTATGKEKPAFKAYQQVP